VGVQISPSAPLLNHLMKILRFS